MKRLSILFLLFMVSSCKTVYNKVNGVNKNISFSSVKEYKTHVSTKTKLDTDKFYFVDNNDYNNFLGNILNQNIVYYYGLVKNKKIVASGSNLKEKSSCYGAISDYIQNNYTNDESNIKSKISDFSYYNFDEEKAELNFNKEVLVFIYSYKLGKLSNNLENLINDIEQNINIDYIILSLDNVDIKTKIQY